MIRLSFLATLANAQIEISFRFYAEHLAWNSTFKHEPEVIHKKFDLLGFSQKVEDKYEAEITVQVDRIYTKTYIHLVLRLNDGDENTASDIGGNKHF